MRTRPMVAATLVAVALAGYAATRSIADSAGSAPPADQSQMQLPPGWTMEDMQKMMAAGTPGEMQKRLTDDVGTWHCKCTMWMSPDADPIVSEGTSTVTPLMDGRYVQLEMKGEMPGMGPYQGAGIYGYDNVSKEFVSTWIDNFSTGMMTGKGKLSDDGKTLTWDYVANCPLREGPIRLQDIETITGPNTKTLVTMGPDRKTGEVYKMMQIEMTRQQ